MDLSSAQSLSNSGSVFVNAKTVAKDVVLENNLALNLQRELNLQTEHTKNARQSTKAKHEKGQARGAKQRGGYKGQKIHQGRHQKDG